MLLQLFGPYQKARNNRDISVKCEYCKPRSRAGRNSEEVTEYSLILQHVYIYQQPNVLAALERFKNCFDGHHLIYSAIAGKLAVAIGHAVYQRIV